MPEYGDRKLKVYGWITFRRGGQMRRIVAAPSWTEVARVSGEPVSALRAYGSISGNSRELAAALPRPGVLLERPLDDRDADYMEVPNG